MSLIQQAFLQSNQPPTKEELQKAIDQLGFDFYLDHDFDLMSFLGFLPCKLNGQETGFEIYYDPTSEILTEYKAQNNKTKSTFFDRIFGRKNISPHEQLLLTIGERDWCITFRWSADMHELASVLITCLALIDLYDAVIYYPDDDLVYDRNSLLEDVKTCFDEI